ncbi:MAG: hypothetical protein ACPHOD_02200 [Flavobacteriaceae bacterium]
MASDIHNRIEYIIDSERLSISAFERQIGVGRNSISTSLRKKSSISHEVIKKIHIHFPNYSVDWIIFGNENETEVEIKKIICRTFGNFQTMEKRKRQKFLTSLNNIPIQIF